MNCAVDRTGLRDSPYTGIKHIIISRDQLTCVQRICGLTTRDNHLHGLTRSKYYVAGVEDMRIWSVGSRTDLIGTGNQFVWERVHGGEIKSKVGVEGTHTFNLVMAAIESAVTRCCFCKYGSKGDQEERAK